MGRGGKFEFFEREHKRGTGIPSIGSKQVKDDGKGEVVEDGYPRDLQLHLGDIHTHVLVHRPSRGGAPQVWGRWNNLFGVKPIGKPSFPKIIDKSDKEKGVFVVEVPFEIIDHNILGMELTLVGKFIGPQPNIDLVSTFARKKWDLKG